MALGIAVGKLEGSTLGATVVVGSALGIKVGPVEGDELGEMVVVGDEVVLGRALGNVLGELDGTTEEDGASEGGPDLVGLAVGVNRSRDWKNGALG